MPKYIVPNFNLSCVFYTEGVVWPFATTPPVLNLLLPRPDTPCALTFGRRTASTALTRDAQSQQILMDLLVPKGSFVVTYQNLVPLAGKIRIDVIEVPKSSRRFYYCVGYDDIGRGYPNEHRCCVLTAIPGTWPLSDPGGG